MAEEAVAAMPLESLEWYHEKYILDYFAEVGLFIKHGMYAWAEVTLRQLIKLRCDSPDIGLDHYETRQLQKYLEQCLRAQHKHKDANEIAQELAAYGELIFVGFFLRQLGSWIDSSLKSLSIFSSLQNEPGKRKRRMPSFPKTTAGFLPAAHRRGFPSVTILRSTKNLT